MKLHVTQHTQLHVNMKYFKFIKLDNGDSFWVAFYRFKNPDLYLPFYSNCHCQLPFPGILQNKNSRREFLVVINVYECEYGWLQSATLT
jgi:hypothetical protein